jgi:hypothetical protein
MTLNPDYRTSAIADGYIYECSCGELYRVLDAAKHCRKCWTYTERGMCTRVDNIETGEVVYDFESVLVRREAEEKAAREAYDAACRAPFTLGDACPKLASLSL